MFRPAIYRSVTYDQWQLLDAIETLSSSSISYDIDWIRRMFSTYVSEQCIQELSANIDRLLSLGILYKTVMGPTLMIAINHKWYPQHGDSRDERVRNILINEYHINMNDPADVAKLERLTNVVSKLIDDVKPR